MHDHLNEVCDALEYSYRDLAQVNGQLRENSGQFDPSRMNYFNQLTHSIKSLETTKAMLEATEERERGDYGERGSYGERGRYGWRMPYPPYYRSGYDEAEDYGRGGRGGSYGRNQDRDSRGRYADDGMREKLRTMMANTRDENTRMELQRMMDSM